MRGSTFVLEVDFCNSEIPKNGKAVFCILYDYFNYFRLARKVGEFCVGDCFAIACFANLTISAYPCVCVSSKKLPKVTSVRRRTRYSSFAKPRGL